MASDIEIMAVVVFNQHQLLDAMGQALKSQLVVNDGLIAGFKQLLQDNEELKQRIERLESWSNN